MSVDMNHSMTQASLDNLHDIIVPDTVGFFPLAPGWYLVLLLLLALLFHFGYSYYKAYQKEQYRRDAKAELEALHNKNRESTVALLGLAKRVAISAYGREIIVPLYGDTWWDFIESHSSAIVAPEMRGSIAKLLYEEGVVFDAYIFDTVYLMVSQWIKTHKAVSDV